VERGVQGGRNGRKKSGDRQKLETRKNPSSGRHERRRGKRDQALKLANADVLVQKTRSGAASPKTRRAEGVNGGGGARPGELRRLRKSQIVAQGEP